MATKKKTEAEETPEERRQRLVDEQIARYNAAKAAAAQPSAADRKRQELVDAQTKKHREQKEADLKAEVAAAKQAAIDAAKAAEAEDE